MNLSTTTNPLNFSKRHVANLNANRQPGNGYRASWPTVATIIG